MATIIFTYLFLEIPTKDIIYDHARSVCGSTSHIRFALYKHMHLSEKLTVGQWFYIVLYVQKYISIYETS